MEAIIEVLPVTAGRMFRVWWAYFWRSLVTLFAMFVVIILSSIVFGVLFSLAMPVLGLEMEAAQGLSRITGMVFGFLAGLLSSIIPVWLILDKDFGDFRLALINYQPVNPGGEQYNHQATV